MTEIRRKMAAIIYKLPVNYLFSLFSKSGGATPAGCRGGQTLPTYCRAPLSPAEPR